MSINLYSFVVDDNYYDEAEPVAYVASSSFCAVSDNSRPDDPSGSTLGVSGSGRTETSQTDPLPRSHLLPGCQLATNMALKN